MVGGSIKSYLLKRVSTVRIRPGAPEIDRARYRYGAGLFWSKGRIRAVDTRVTNMGRISSSSARATLPVARTIRAASVRIVCATYPVRGRPKT